jgi:hypothetical protein
MDVLVLKAIDEAEISMDAKHVKQIKIIIERSKSAVSVLSMFIIEYPLTIIAKEVLAYLYAHCSGR